MRRKPTPMLLLAAVILAGCEDECTRPGWGQPLSYMAAADVREMVVSGSDRKLHAYRSAEGEPFEIAIAYKAGDRVERCRSGPGFMCFLDAMVTLQVICRSWHGVYSISSEWFVVELWPAGGDHGTPHRLRPPVPGYPWSVMEWVLRRSVPGRHRSGDLGEPQIGMRKPRPRHFRRGMSGQRLR